MEIFLKILGALANAASVVTASIALWAYFRFRSDRNSKMTRLEAHLKAEKPKGRMAIAIIDLVAELGMTESDIMDASFRSASIGRLTTSGMIGAPSRIMLQYVGK